MTSSEIRAAFLDFFAARDHTIVPSSSLVPDDPTLLLTAAGMVQFKPVFLGKRSAEYTRAASSQKCVRTTDIERVGHTARHLTFFEMLGNFSFGDYYKREASSWAWEFLTRNLALPTDRLWVTVFETDEEAYDIWTNEIGVDPGRVVRLGEKDNFWAAGPTGPCGPCSEIIYDFGPERSCERPDCGVGCDCDRFLEIWNLVFMQYNRDEKGELHPLPKKNIDTGMGLERLASVLQGAETNFETDLLKPLVDLASHISGVEPGRGDTTDVSLKVIADHIRAVTFMIGDGILPGNEGRGYVLRRLLRRALRHGKLLGIEEPFAARLARETITLMGTAYDALLRESDTILEVVSTEEERFDRTLRQGLAVMREVVDDVENRRATEVAAEAAFKLYDTYGFPLELTEEIAAEAGLSVDREGFEELMQQQRARARKGAVSGHAQIFVKNVFPQISEEYGPSEFVGYQEEEIDARVVAIVSGDATVSAASAGDEVEIILDRTPFYAEMGGQVGDTGVLSGPTGKGDVLDTYSPVAGLTVHKVAVTEGTIRVEDAVSGKVDHRRRIAIARNHTGTHLLHWALRAVLGEQATQAGSLVDADRLRFDFRHPRALTDEELTKVEALVNEKAFQDHAVRTFTTTVEYAKELGAMALFEEKYGQFVRVVEIGNFSRELCGGVHLHTTSQLGPVKITSESSVGSGLRRIEAVTGEKVLAYFQERERLLKETTAQVGGKRVEDLPRLVSGLLERLEAAAAERRGDRSKELADMAAALEKDRRAVDALEVIVAETPAGGMEELRELADRARARSPRTVVVLAAKTQDKALLLVAAGKEAVQIGFDSRAVISELLAHFGGGGGGRPDLAQAGGGSPEKLAQTLREAERMLLAKPVKK